MRFGLVTEGKSEWLVFERVIRSHIDPSATFIRFRPDLTLTSGSPFGWKGVRHWCLDNQARLHAVLRGVVGSEIDVLVIHLDCSMAHNVGALRPCPPPEATADELRSVVLNEWLGGITPPIPTIVAAVSRTIDTWIAPVLTPPFVPSGHLECSDSVEDELVKRRLLRRKDGEVKKPELKFAPLADMVADGFSTVAASCSLAMRFADEVRAAVSP